MPWPRTDMTLTRVLSTLTCSNRTRSATRPVKPASERARATLGRCRTSRLTGFDRALPGVAGIRTAASLVCIIGSTRWLQWLEA